jgi:hypothetical protein
MRRWGGVGRLFSILGWPTLLYGAVFETQHMGIIVGEATTPLPSVVALGEAFEVPPQEIVSIIGLQDDWVRANQSNPSLPAAIKMIANSGCSGSL